MSAAARSGAARPSPLHRFLSQPPLGVLIAVLAFGAAWTFITRLPAAESRALAAPPSPRVGFSAPDITLETLDGKPLTLSALRGHPVLLNIWASWCLPCRVEMPAIERVYRRHAEDGLVVIGLNATAQDSEADARAFVAELGLTFPILLDRNGEASAAYNLMALPSTYFIDRDGITRDVIIGGPMSEALMLSSVEELLRQP